MNPTWYPGEGHQGFELQGSSGGALLLHGFMGTPLEVRPLARALNARGFSAIGPLLPGFGTRIDSIDKVSREDWLGEARAIWQGMHDRGIADVLIGFSMGGSIALHLAASLPPKRLVLLAPLWKMLGGDWRVNLLPIFKMFVRTLRPFAGANFDDPEIRRFFSESRPDLDLDDAKVQRDLRDQTRISTRTLDELRRLSLGAGRASRSINTSTLVIQGRFDETVRSLDTRKLASEMDGEVSFEELEADHFLVFDDKPSWPEVRDLVLGFSSGVLR
jgi:carboxylesterase